MAPECGHVDVGARDNDGGGRGRGGEGPLLRPVSLVWPTVPGAPQSLLAYAERLGGARTHRHAARTRQSLALRIGALRDRDLLPIGCPASRRRGCIARNASTRSDIWSAMRWAAGAVNDYWHGWHGD